jgi:alanine racemase
VLPWLDVDLAALLRNARRYSEQVGAGVSLLPMVKADGYGLGALPVARALEAIDPWGFGVAHPEEGETLRRGGIARPIVVFVPLGVEQIDRDLEFNLRPVIGDLATMERWLERTERPFHVEIDTGMARGGFRWHDEAGLIELGRRLHRAPGFEGILTHFSAADSSLDLTAEQWERFEAARRTLGSQPRWIHAGNSGAGQWNARFSGNLARPGIFLYGGRAGLLVPEPVASLHASVVAVRSIRRGDPVSYGGTFRAAADGEVVTLGIGYADGFPRSLSNRGLVAIGDRTFTVAGRVTMDMVMVVTPTGTARVGQPATLFGGPIDLDRQAELAGTISYELLTAVGRRVARLYQGVP